MILRRFLDLWAGPLLIALATAGMVVRSWLRWPDALVDYGQQLYVAWQLAEGQVLYRDVAYFHGPLSSYVHAGVFRLWGTGLLSLVIFNLLVVLALVVVLYKLMSELAGRWAASAAGLVFVTVFAFSQYLRIGNYNYVCPYTSEITHGVALALGAVYLLALYLRRRARSLLVAAGLVLGLVFLTKAEVFFAAAAALGAGILADVWREQGRLKDAAFRIAVLTGAAAVGPVLAFALFCLAVPPSEALQAVTAAYSALVRDGTSELLFYRSRMGLDAPRANLGRLLVTTVWHVLALGPAVLAALVAAKRPAWKWGLLAGAWLPLAVLAWNVGSTAWLQAARPLPLFMLLLVAASIWALSAERRGRTTVFRGSAAAVLTLAVFALVLLLKIVLNSRVYHYGFVLAMPATLLVVVAWLEWIPARLEAYGATGRWVRGIAVAVFAVAVVAHVLVSERRWAEKTYLVAGGADAFWSDPRGQAIDAVVEYLAQAGEEPPTLVVVPDGILLNYLARAPSTVPYLNYVPTEVFAYGEATILARLREHPPDYVAIVEKSTAEFGYRYFGHDYARDILRWIEGAYESVGVIGAKPLTGQGFGIELMKRRRPRSRE